MLKEDKEKVVFMTNMTNYFVLVMPIGLKNVRASYQRLMDKIFMNELRRNLKVYVDDMVVKKTSTTFHAKDLAKIFA